MLRLTNIEYSTHPLNLDSFKINTKYIRFEQ